MPPGSVRLPDGRLVARGSKEEREYWKKTHRPDGREKSAPAKPYKVRVTVKPNSDSPSKPVRGESAADRATRRKMEQATSREALAKQWLKNRTQNGKRKLSFEDAVEFDKLYGKKEDFLHRVLPDAPKKSDFTRAGKDVWGAWEGFNKFWLGDVYEEVEDSTKPESQRRKHSDLNLGIAAIGALPFGKPLRGAAAGVAAVKGLTKAEHPAEAAYKYYHGAGAAKRASSFGAKHAANAMEKAGAPKGLVDLVRNSPDAKRIFRNEGAKEQSEVWTDYSKSRIGKLGEKAYDKARPVLSKGPTVKGRRVAIAKTEQEKWAQALEWQAHEAHKRGQIGLVQLDAALTKGVVRKYVNRLKVPEFYALRMVGKGVDPDTFVARFKGLAEEARAAGDNARATRLDYHASMAEAAKPLVAIRGGDVVFSDAASRKLRHVYGLMEQASKQRESIYDDLGLLADSRADMRMVNEELWHYGATWRNTEEFIAERFAASPNRQKLYEILQAKDPINADSHLAALDAMARQWMDARMQNMAGGIHRLRAKVETSTDPNDARLLRRLEAEFKRGLDPDNFYRQWGETLDAFPKELHDQYGSGTLMEIAPFHTFAETKAAKNLAQRLNPRNAKKGLPENKAIFRTYEKDGVKTRVAVAGNVTPAQWVKRVMAVMPDPSERRAWSQWYDEFEPMFRSIFADDADALMRGFAVSQANASPGSGLRAVFKIMEALSRGEKVESGYGSVVAASIAKAVEGGEIDKGIAAKLSDFIDSLMKSETRTWMGHDVRGGRPVAVDVHAARDRGLIDRKIRTRLKENFGLDEGTHYTMDNPQGSPSGVMYEQTQKWYENLTDHLNAIKFDGRSDWEPRQVQALGWASIQMLHGVDPQDFSVALGQNTRRVSFEVTQGPGNLGADLTPEQATAVAKALEPDMRRLVEASGGYLNGVKYSVDGWAGGTNAGVHLDVIGTDEAIEKMLTLTAQAFDQGLVQGTRTITRQGAKAALVISSPAFSDEAVKASFMKALYEASEELSQHGFMADTFMNAPAVKIITGRNYLSPKTIDKFLDRYSAAIEQAEEQLGISVRYGTKNTEIRIGDQVGRADFNDAAGRARELDDLDPLAADIRGRLTGLIESARSGRPLPDGLASRDAARAAGDAAGAAAESGEAALGRKLLAGRTGYEEAAAQLQGGTVPVEWLQKLVRDSADIPEYDKFRIGAHLDWLSVSGGGPSLYGMKLQSVPGLEKFLTPTVLRGMFRPKANQLIIGPQGKVPTVFHELTHMMQIKGLLPESFLDDVKKFLKVEGDWTEQQMEDLAAIVEATLLGFDAGVTKLPADIAKPLAKLRLEFLKDAAGGGGKKAQKMLDKLDESGPLGTRIRDAVEALFDAAPKKGNRFHGASDQFRDRAKMYMPETLGLPASYGKDLFAMRSYIARMGNALGHKSTILPGDKALSHEFTAHLLESGAFDRNIVKGTLQSQLKASRIYAMSVIQKEARKIGFPTPQSADDIAIPASGVRFAGTQGKDADFVAGMLSSIDEGKVISKAELDNVDEAAIAQARDFLFPGSTKSTEEETRKLAEEIMAGVREPIEGVVWVNRQDLINTAAFDQRRYGLLNNPVSRGVNDYLKALLLVLKPSYVPMNWVGNAAMALMQQGAFAPINFARAYNLNRKLGDDAVLIDFFMGSGAMQTVFGSKGGVPLLTPTLDKAAELSGWLVDRYWRRAAFLYEARKMGYRTEDQLRALLKDATNVDDLTTVAKNGKNAMVDFENLSQFEKDVMGNAMFVYPWFKGATYWTGKFAKDHPLQAATYTYLMAQQQDRLGDALPDGRPGYLKWFLPIGTSKRDGTEMPYGLRLDQALTFLTPADLAADAAAYATGGRVALLGDGDPEAMASKLNPLYEELLKTLTGYDSFTGQPVDKGLPDLLMRLLPSERSVAWQQFLSIMDDGKRERSMYKPTEREAWMKLFLGSLSPGVVDPAKAADRAKGLRQTRSPEENLDSWKEKAKRAFGEEPPEWLVQYKRNEQTFNRMVGEVEADAGYPEGGLTTQERLVAAFKAMAEIEGRSWNREEEILGLDEDTAEQMYSDIRRDLGLTQIGQFDDDLSAKRKEQRVNG